MAHLLNLTKCLCVVAAHNALGIPYGTVPGHTAPLCMHLQQAQPAPVIGHNSLELPKFQRLGVLVRLTAVPNKLGSWLAGWRRVLLC